MGVVSLDPGTANLVVAYTEKVDGNDKVKTAYTRNIEGLLNYNKKRSEKVYSKLTEERIRSALINDATITLERLSKKLGCAPQTMKKRLIQLGIDIKIDSKGWKWSESMKENISGKNGNHFGKKSPWLEKARVKARKALKKKWADDYEGMMKNRVDRRVFDLSRTRLLDLVYEKKLSSRAAARVVGCSDRLIRVRLEEHGLRSVWSQWQWVGYYCKGQNPTQCELSLYRILTDIGVKFIPQYDMLRWNVDAFLPKYKLAIEADGEYWHRNRAESDRKKDFVLSLWGVQVLRFTDSELLTVPGEVAERILKEIRNVG